MMEGKKKDDGRRGKKKVKERMPDPPSRLTQVMEVVFLNLRPDFVLMIS